MQREVTRREALAGAAGIAALSFANTGADAIATTVLRQDSKPVAEYAPRDYKGLIGTPGFSQKLLEAHFTLYQGYVKNVNLDFALLAELGRTGPPSAPAAAEVRRRFGWEFNGMRLHELYFENLGGKEPPAKDNKAAMKIAAAFGSLEAWDKEFRGIAAMRGIGWVALMHDPVADRLFNVWINEHDVGVLAGGSIILIMDVFEHAYIADYGIKRADYIDAFMKAIEWTAVAKRV